MISQICNYRENKSGSSGDDVWRVSVSNVASLLWFSCGHVTGELCVCCQSGANLFIYLLTLGHQISLRYSFIVSRRAFSFSVAWSEESQGLLSFLFLNLFLTDVMCHYQLLLCYSHTSCRMSG